MPSRISAKQISDEYYTIKDSQKRMRLMSEELARLYEMLEVQKTADEYRQPDNNLSAAFLAKVLCLGGEFFGIPTQVLFKTGKEQRKAKLPKTLSGRQFSISVTKATIVFFLDKYCQMDRRNIARLFLYRDVSHLSYLENQVPHSPHMLDLFIKTYKTFFEGDLVNKSWFNTRDVVSIFHERYADLVNEPKAEAQPAG